MGIAIAFKASMGSVRITHFHSHCTPDPITCPRLTETGKAAFVLPVTYQAQ